MNSIESVTERRVRSQPANIIRLQLCKCTAPGSALSNPPSCNALSLGQQEPTPQRLHLKRAPLKSNFTFGAPCYTSECAIRSWSSRLSGLRGDWCGSRWVTMAHGDAKWSVKGSDVVIPPLAKEKIRAQKINLEICFCLAYCTMLYCTVTSHK